MKVRRGRGLRQRGFVADQDLDGNIVSLGVDDAALDEHPQTAQAAPAVEHLEGTARLLQRRDQQVLQDTPRLDIGRHLGDFEQVVGPLADIDGRERELRELNGSGHGKSSIWRPDQPEHQLRFPLPSLELQDSNDPDTAGSRASV